MNNLGTKADTIKTVRAWQGRTMAVPSKFVSEDVFYLQTADLANSPKIDPGDLVLVNPHDIVQPGNFVVAWVAAIGGVCRRYRPLHAIDTARFELVSSHPDYPAIQVAGEAEGEVIGRAFKVLKDL